MSMSMSIYSSLIIMFFSSFLVQYFLMSWIMSNSISNVTNSLGKFYISILMGLLMVLIELFMNGNKNIYLYFTTIIWILLFIYLYRKQVWIGDKAYLSEMIQHHSMAILTSEEIMKKTENNKVADLANQIVQTQTKEIDEMKELISTYA